MKKGVVNLNTHNKLLKAVRNPLLVPLRLKNAFRGFLMRRKKAGIDLDEERGNLLDFLSVNFNVNAFDIYSEYISSEFKTWYNAKESELMNLIRNSGVCSDFDCAVLYLLVRSVKPDIVVETGVLYGSSSAHILEALQENGTGQLYSIDLPNDPDQPSQDFFVRDVVKGRWQLIIGDAKVELPKLLSRLNRIDLFFHDSLHSFDHMLWEYSTAFKHFSPGGVLSSHDVLTLLPFERNAFHVFCKQHRLRYQVFRNLGIALCSGSG
jgi:predicted O-methyltransferase YrrM